MVELTPGPDETAMGIGMVSAMVGEVAELILPGIGFTEKGAATLDSVDVIPDGTGMGICVVVEDSEVVIEVRVVLELTPGPDGAAMGIGIVGAMVAELIPDGTAMVAGTVVMEFKLAEVILDGTIGMVIIANVAVVLEVTEVRPDGESMVISVLTLAASPTTLAPISVKASVADVATKDAPDGESIAASLAVLAPNSALTLGFKLLLMFGRWAVGRRIILLGESCGMVVEMKFVANEVNFLASTMVSEFLIYV